MLFFNWSMPCRVILFSFAVLSNRCGEVLAKYPGNQQMCRLLVLRIKTLVVKKSPPVCLTIMLR
jgi:hypothetical protein